MVDRVVGARLLKVLAPEEIALALAAADEVATRKANGNRALELRSNGRATRRRVLSAHSIIVIPTTAWWPAALSGVGRKSCATSPRPNVSWPARSTNLTRPRAPRSRLWPQIFRGYGPRPQPRTKIASVYFARSSAMSL